MTDTDADPLAGLMPRPQWARKALNKSDRTAKRLQDAGRIVVTYIGKDPYVVLEATARRLRGEDRPRRNGRGPK